MPARRKRKHAQRVSKADWRDDDEMTAGRREAPVSLPEENEIEGLIGATLEVARLQVAMDSCHNRKSMSTTTALKPEPKSIETSMARQQ